MLQTFLETKINNLYYQNVWFQQNGATAHTARRLIKPFIKPYSYLLSLGGDVQWPAQSPNLDICDFFLWGFLKSWVYKNRPSTTEELKNAICLHILKIPSRDGKSQTRL